MQPRSTSECIAGLESSLRSLRRFRQPERRVASATELLDVLGCLAAEVSALRDQAMHELRARGATHAEIATVAGLTRARVAQVLRRYATS